MAQQKMHCAVQGNYSDNQKICEGGKSYSLNKSLEKDNLKASFEGSELTSLNSKNSNNRCAVLTVYTPESVGLWRIVAVPPACLDHTDQLGSVAQANMDGLHLVSPSINSFKVDRRKSRKEPVRDVTYPVKAFTPRKFPGSDVRQQYRNRALANNVTKLNELSSNSSSQSSSTCSNSSSAIQRRSSSLKSSNIFTENPEVENIAKRNSRNKSRKKGKQSRKVSRDSVSTGPEVVSEDYAHGSLTSEPAGNIDMDHRDGLLSCATSLDDSFLDSRINVNHVEGGGGYGISNNSESPKICTSYIDEANLSDAEVSSAVPSFPRGHRLTASKIIQMEDEGSVTDGGVEETCPSRISCYDGVHSNGFSKMHEYRIRDSVSVGSNSDNSFSASYDAKPYDRESNKSSLSESVDFRSRKGSSSPPNLTSSVVDLCDYTEGKRYANQCLDSSDMQVAIPVKRNKKAKMVQGSSTALKAQGDRISRTRTGKEYNNCVWKKVQKNDADERRSESKKATAVCLQFYGTLKERSSIRRNSDLSNVNNPSKSEDKKQLKDKVSRKLKRKISPGSKHEYKSYSRRATYPSKTGSNARGKISSQPNETLDVSGKNQKRVSSAPSSHSQVGATEFGFLSNKVESLISESSHSSEDCTHNLESTEIVSNTVSAMKEHQDKSCCSLDRMNMLEVPSPHYLPHLIFNEVGKTEKDTSNSEHGKQNHISGSPPQKWIPIGTKDPKSMTSVNCGSLPLGHAGGRGAEDWTLRKNVDKKADSSSQNLISSLNVEMMSMGLDSGSKSWQDDENRRVGMKAHASKGSNPVAADCLIGESKDQNFSSFRTAINKILQAVDGARRMQAAHEAVQMATGGPIAEFERFLHFSSPVISFSHNSIRCKDCSEDHVLGASLYRHEIHNISLGCLWQWYEKLGSYGLEIRAEDYEQSNRLGADRFSFRAYFVPFLSAVQLFRNCKSQSSNDGHGFRTSRVSGTSETGKTLQRSSNNGHLPIYSVLVPQPRTSHGCSLPPVEECCKSQWSSVSNIVDSSVPSVGMTQSDDLELLFEYFESEQPRHRRPLYEKIQELVTGEEPSNCNVYGDRTILNTINLHDLHPASWYSVAWYPIYRIPDGNFRAAFLTYHSLGHIVHRSAKADTADGEVCIVSPALGLQSYNAQSECWFQLKHPPPSQTSESSNLNPLVILKERLRTLEETASVMSRAVVNKGNQTSVNRHSDYEFFLSRRRSGLP